MNMSERQANASKVDERRLKMGFLVGDGDSFGRIGVSKNSRWGVTEVFRQGSWGTNIT